MSITFDGSCPERGWEPFLDWMRAEGIDPVDCASLVVHDDGTVTARFHAYDRHGKHAIDGDQLASYEKSGRVGSQPPLHPDRQAVPS